MYLKKFHKFAQNNFALFQYSPPRAIVYHISPRVNTSLITKNNIFYYITVTQRQNI